MLRFETWLTEQQDREDYIGEFACFWAIQDISSALSKRRSDEHKLWADLVSRIAPPGHITAFNEAWQEFLLRADAKEALD